RLCTLPLDNTSEDLGRERAKGLDRKASRLGAALAGQQETVEIAMSLRVREHDAHRDTAADPVLGSHFRSLDREVTEELTGHLEQQGGLVVVVSVEGRARDVRPNGDVVDRDRRIGLLGDQIEECVLERSARFALAPVEGRWGRLDCHLPSIQCILYLT